MYMFPAFSGKARTGVDTVEPSAFAEKPAASLPQMGNAALRWSFFAVKPAVSSQNRHKVTTCSVPTAARSLADIDKFPPKLLMALDF
jgi:hypothetical protein